MKAEKKLAQRGTSLVEFAFLLTFVLVPLFLLCVDFGRGYWIGIEVSEAARSAAQFGMSQTGASVTALQSAATAAAPDLTGMTAVAVTGCMCSDETSQQTPCSTTVPPTCAGTRLINYVQINTQYNYTPLFNPHAVFAVLPATLTIKGQALFPTGT